MSVPRSAKGRPSSSACPSDRLRRTGTEIVATRQRWLTRKFCVPGLVVAIALGWSGCTATKPIASPPPGPKAPVSPPAPLPPKTEPVAPVLPQPPKKELETPPAKKEAPPPPAKVPPPAQAPPPAKKEPVAPVPPPPPKTELEAPPEKKEPEAPPPVLAPQVGDEERLRRTADSRIQRTEQLVGQLEGKSLTSEQQERLMTVRTLLGNAKEALAGQDLTKASNLAEKARLLAEELSQSVK